MKYAREGLLLPEKTQPPADRELADELAALSRDTQETYKDLVVTDERKAEVLSAWHNGDSASLTADHLDESHLEERLQRLRGWKADLLQRDDIAPEIKQAYRWRINENIANVYMLRASAQGDIHSFKRWNEFIYGKPDEAIYRGALDAVAHDAETFLADPEVHPAVAAAATNVLERLDGERGYRELLAPEKETFDAVRDDHRRAGGYYALLLAGVAIPNEGKIANDPGDSILEHVVRENLQSDYSIQDASGASWGVSHGKRAVERPATYNMPWRRFVGLGLGHEIGSHLLEKVNGERGPLALATSGLDRYELGNEGRAVIREQVAYDSFDEFGKLVRWRDILRRHIAISYGSGVGDDNELKPSGETYALMNTIDTMYQTKLTPDDPQATFEKAQKKTDTLLLRVLKGGVYLKDKVYLEGHVACWRTAAERGVGSISEGDLGKFDINNPRHITLLQQYGLLPDNKEA